jgi:hypothetical protein
MASDNHFRDCVVAARYLSMTELARDALEIVDDTDVDMLEVDDFDAKGNKVKRRMPNAVAVQSKRLRFDARKWILSKLDPKFADKLEDLARMVAGGGVINFHGFDDKPAVDKPEDEAEPS